MSVENDFDVVIVGAGPAGLFLANKLDGFKVLVLDKKKDAEDVQYNTLASFMEPNRYKLPVSILNPINQIRISSKNRSVIKKGLAYIINRRKLLSFFEAEARKNTALEIAYSAVIREIEFVDGWVRRIVYSRDGKDAIVTAKIFVDCSGLNVALGSKVGLAQLKTHQAVGAEYTVPLKKEPHTSDLFLGGNVPGGYGWIFPVNEGKAIAGYGTLSEEYFPEAEKRLLNMWQIKRMNERCDLNIAEKHIAVLRTGRPLKNFVKNNLVLVGDTALQSNPLVGEGVRFVIDSAKIASRWIRGAIEKNDLSLLRGYEKEWRRKYYRKYKIAFWLQRKLEKYTKNDDRIDYLVEKINKVSDKDFVRLLSGELSYPFLLRLAINAMLKR